MSFTQWILLALFTMALSFQPDGIAYATPTSIFLVTDQSSGSSQNTQRDSRSGKKGMSDAESNGKMQSDKDAQPDGERMGGNFKAFDQSREQGTSDGSSQKDPNYASGGPSTPPGSSNPGMSGAGTGAGNR